MPLTRSLTSNLIFKSLTQYTLVQSFLLSWCITLAAQIKVPYYPIPMTMEDCIIMVIALTVAPSVAMGAIFLFLSYAIIGLPVLSSGATGLTILISPTAGFLVGFILMSVTIAVLKELCLSDSFWIQLWITMIGNIVLFSAGLSWLAYLMGWHMAVRIGLLPFVWINVTKVLLAASLATYWKRGLA